MSSRARSQYQTQLELLFEQVWDDLNEGLDETGLSDLQFFWESSDGLRIYTGVGNYGGEILWGHSVLEYLPGEFLSEIDQFLRSNPGIDVISYRENNVVTKLDDNRDPIRIEREVDVS